MESLYHVGLFVEAFHVISVIMWMAGMLYLPRLYVYHASTEPHSDASSLISTMERRLMLYIMHPAMASTVLLGTTLAIIEQAYLFGWFWIKMVFVACMLLLHMFFARCRKSFALNKRVHSALFFKILNETVTVLIVCIVLTVIVVRHLTT
ncbi:CopD family protein [Anaplasma platys]|uniref:CopD family protein n=1 Tax=Anaplasma platys TaxID=949 RepID=UPI0023513E7A|nr:CopD family protein [Anaplasma platys]